MGVVIFSLWMLAATAGGYRSYRNLLNEIPVSTDLKYDFVSAYWIAQGRPLETLDRRTADAVGVSLGTQEGPYFDGPAQTHPPPAVALLRPLVPLGYPVATWVWAAMSALALLFVGRLLLAIWRRSPSLPPWRASWPVSAAVLLWPPGIYNLSMGQWSALVALAVAAVWWNLERGAGRQASVWMAVALALRPTPAVLFGHLAPRSRRFAVEAALIFAVLVLALLPVAGGLSAWRVFRDSGPAAVRVWEGSVDNTVSIRGIIVRLFMDTEFIRAPFNHPALAHGLAIAASLALIVLALVVDVRRRKKTGTKGPDGVAFAMWCCLITLLNPLSWPHNALVLLIPATLIARDAGPGRLRIAVGTAIVLSTIPTETLTYLAAGASKDLPVSATRGWLLGLHALGGIILFAAAAVASTRVHRRTASLTPAGAGPTLEPG